MKNLHRHAVLILALAAAAMSDGCADQLVSDDTIRHRTAIDLGVPDNAVSVLHRRYDGENVTYYDVRVRGTPRLYNCILTGGTVLDLGQPNGVGCEPEGSKPTFTR
jgi:hypothetical protein